MGKYKQKTPEIPHFYTGDKLQETIDRDFFPILESLDGVQKAKAKSLLEQSLQFRDKFTEGEMYQIFGIITGVFKELYFESHQKIKELVWNLIIVEDIVSEYSELKPIIHQLENFTWIDQKWWFINLFITNHIQSIKARIRPNRVDYIGENSPEFLIQLTKLERDKKLDSIIGDK